MGRRCRQLIKNQTHRLLLFLLYYINLIECGGMAYGHGKKI